MLYRILYTVYYTLYTILYVYCIHYTLYTIHITHYTHVHITHIHEGISYFTLCILAARDLPIVSYVLSLGHRQVNFVLSLQPAA